MTAGRKPHAADNRRPGATAGVRAQTRAHAVPMLEVIVGGLGALLVGGAIAFLVYHSLLRDRTPPDVRVVAERVLDLADGYLVQFRAFNEGGSVTAAVTIEGELAGPDGQTEVSEVVLDYLPPRSDREGGLWFSQDPRTGELSLRAKGYAKP
jgi:uncharacterized protein (TIGR02588 family)